MRDEQAVDRVVERVLARLEGNIPSGKNLDGRSCTACATRGQCASVCPVTTTAMLRAGATRVSNVPGAAETVVSDMAGMIDHTLLRPNTSWEEVRTLLKEAQEYRFASVCVNPFWVKRCNQFLARTVVRVCTVVGFPLGANTSETKAFETRRACYDGAKEIDMVINIGALKSGDCEAVERDIRSVVESAGTRVLVKAIIEAAHLTEEEKVNACLAARRAGAHFVKTSTGFGPGGATVDDVRIMREVVGTKMGVKAAGGIRTRKDADEMIRAGASRIGASASVAIVKGE